MAKASLGMKNIECLECGFEFEVGENNNNRKYCGERCAYRYSKRRYVDGVRPAGIRYEILERDNFTCKYCGASPLTDKDVKLQVDHIFPRSKYGSNGRHNLITSCQQCNIGKSNHIMSQASRDRINEYMESVE